RRRQRRVLRAAQRRRCAPTSIPTFARSAVSIADLESTIFVLSKSRHDADVTFFVPARSPRDTGGTFFVQGMSMRAVGRAGIVPGRAALNRRRQPLLGVSRRLRR